jgi:ribosomal protein S12 methylthiotransferase
MGTSKQPVVSLISLGCAKNTVDSERILGQLVTSGFLVAEDPAEADICLVNTCGFIHDAREESAGVLEQVRRMKKSGRLKAVVALGCLVERAQSAGELGAFLDAADTRVGFQDYPRLAEICRGLTSGPVRAAAPDERGVPVQIGDLRAKRRAAAPGFAASYEAFLTAPRLRVGSPHLAYLKISEGCSNFCRFCSIPYIRGVQASRPLEAICAEARQLLDIGAREIGLIAQDTTSYGRDLYGRPRLADLLRGVAQEVGDGGAWLRLMYAFPRFLEDEMLEVLAGDPCFCPYIDMPLQHISERMLQHMGRGMGQRDTVALLDRIRDKLPQGAIRTTFIVGYPGETEAEFRELLAFVEEGRFSHAGVFLYSREPRTPSAQVADDVPLKAKQERRDALMKAQLAVSRRRLEAKVGTDVEVMVDGPIPAGTTAPAGAAALGRTRLEAPEVDGVVFLKGRGVRKIEAGCVVRARVTGSLDYDLLAEVRPPTAAGAGAGERL